MLAKRTLEQWYWQENKSMAEIAELFHCSVNKIDYWFRFFSIKKRTIGEALYVKKHPHGDPFCFKSPKTIKQAKLFGLGLGLYWGEGTKRNKNSVRLCNTDPYLIIKFIEFLEEIFGIEQNKLKFGLQIFSDMPAKVALQFWSQMLNAPAEQFYKPIITPARSLGTYRVKTQHGVLTIFYNNTKFRNLLCEMIHDMH